MNYKLICLFANVLLMAGCVTPETVSMAPRDVTKDAIEAKVDRHAALKKAAKNRDTDETRALQREIYADQAAFFAAREGLDDEQWLKEGNPFRQSWKMNGFLRATDAGYRCAAAAGDRLLAIPAWGGEGRKAKNALDSAADCVLRSKDFALRQKAAAYLRLRADLAKVDNDYKGYARFLDRLAMTLLKDWSNRPAAIAVYREGFKEERLAPADRTRFEAMLWQLED